MDVANVRISWGGPSSGLGITLPHRLRKKAAVHHSKNRAMMSQMGQNRSCSGRAQDFRFVPKTRHLRVHGNALVGALARGLPLLHQCARDVGPSKMFLAGGLTMKNFTGACGEKEVRL